jgi:hypothetical protein
VRCEPAEPAFEASEHAGSAAIPSTTSEAASFGLIHGRVYPRPRNPHPRYI